MAYVLHLFMGNDADLHLMDDGLTNCPCDVRIFQVNEVDGEPVFGTLYVHPPLREGGITMIQKEIGGE